MTDAEYAACDAINWSTLKYLRESPLAYLHAISVGREDSLPLMLGRAAHCLIFEPEKFGQRFAIWEGDRRGKEWLAFAEVNERRTILKANEIDDVTRMAEAVRCCPLVQPLLDGAEFERAFVWEDVGSGLQCKARADWLHKPSRTLIDFKSTRSVDGRTFGREAARFGYHMQLAHYRRGCRAHGLEIERVLIVAAEKKPPYDVAVFQIDDVTLDIAEAEVCELLQRLAAHRETGAWPGRYQDIQALDLPAWVYADEDETEVDFGLIVD